MKLITRWNAVWLAVIAASVIVGSLRYGVTEYATRFGHTVIWALAGSLAVYAVAYAVSFIALRVHRDH
jgi:Na+/proline symporter